MDQIISDDNLQFYDDVWDKDWQDMERFNPTARHLQRIIVSLMRTCEGVNSLIDVGCGMGVNLKSVKKAFPDLKLAGTDLSSGILSLAEKYVGGAEENIEYYPLDISKKIINKKFDLVLCNQVLEHIPDDESAIANLVEMSNRYLLITVPSGRYNSTSKLVGHVRHYSQPELISKLKKHNLKILYLKDWGFPFHTIYKSILGSLSLDKQKQVGLGKYGFSKLAISNILYWVFYGNFINKGENILLLAEKK